MLGIGFLGVLRSLGIDSFYFLENPNSEAKFIRKRYRKRLQKSHKLQDKLYISSSMEWIQSKPPAIGLSDPFT